MPSSESAVRLAQSLAARICHDMSGPLSAVITALELAEAEDGAPDEDAPRAVALASARHLAARLRLLRAAWSIGPEPLGAEDIMGLAEGLANRTRLSIDLAGLQPSRTLSPAEGQAVLNALMLAASALPAGGRITIAACETKTCDVRISGPRAAWPARLAELSADTGRAWEARDAREAAMAMAVLLAREAGAALRLRPADGLGDTDPPALVLERQ